MLDVLTRGFFFVTDTPETFMNSEQNFLFDQMMVNVFTEYGTCTNSQMKQNSYKRLHMY